MDIFSLLLLFGSGLIQAMGSVLVKYATSYGNAGGIGQAAFFPLVGIAMLLFTAGGLLYVRSLSRVKLSVAQPVFSATIFLVVTSCSVVIFHEQLTAFQLAGMATIIGGILLVIL